MESDWYNLSSSSTKKQRGGERAAISRDELRVGLSLTSLTVHAVPRAFTRSVLSTLNLVCLQIK